MTPNQKPLTKREAGFAHASKVVKLGWRDNTNPSEIIMDFEAGADWQASLPYNDKQGWIDVGSGVLPDFDKPVLVNCGIYGRYIATYVFVGEFDGIKYGNWHDGKELGVLPPTHWMPLPKSPSI